MKTLLPLLAFACFALPTAGRAQILVDGFDGFETYPVGNLGTQGGWASVNVNGSSAITVTNSIAYQGVQSLSIFDGDSVSRPNARMDLGSNSAEGSFSVALHESTSTTGNDLWRVDFFGTGSTTPHFSIATTSSNISLIGGANGTTSLLNVPLNTTSYSRTAWNTIEVTYNKTSNTPLSFSTEAPRRSSRRVTPARTGRWAASNSVSAAGPRQTSRFISTRSRFPSPRLAHSSAPPC